MRFQRSVTSNRRSSQHRVPVHEKRQRLLCLYRVLCLWSPRFNVLVMFSYMFSGCPFAALGRPFQAPQEAMGRALKSCPAFVEAHGCPFKVALLPRCFKMSANCCGCSNSKRQLSCSRNSLPFRQRITRCCKGTMTSCPRCSRRRVLRHASQQPTLPQFCRV